MKTLALLLLLNSVAHAQATHGLIVTGLSGDPRIAQEFASMGPAVRDALVNRFGASAVLLSESSSPRSDRAGIQNAVAQIARASVAGDRVLVVLIGHGSAQGTEARFNIPGPDVTAAELALLLDALSGRDVAIVVATTSSGAFLPALSGPHRVVVTATRSGAENEEVVFPRYFARALAEDVADTDKNNQLSLAEVFEYARREVARFYEEGNRLATEHALLEDDGDGKGSLQLDAGGDGARARTFVLRAGGAVAASDTVRVLLAQRASLERQVADLKDRKSGMRAEDYDAELETLLLQLARVGRAIRAEERKQ